MMSADSAPTPSISKTARAALLARAGAVGKACKIAFSFGLESDPVVAAELLGKLTLQKRHENIPIYVSTVSPAPNHIPLKSVSDAFSGMPKRSASHRDDWTWELLRDAALSPSTVALLRKFVELFSNGSLPKNMWAYLDPS